MNRIQQLFQSSQKNILSIYFTAGYPRLNDTIPILTELEKNGVDMVEIGMPFSDPLADGPVIQKSSQIALKNGMSLKVLMKQLEGFRRHINLPVLLMGYLNPVLAYGPDRFLKDAHERGIDGIILPDLPLEEYEAHYASSFHAQEISNIFLITPQTPKERIHHIDRCSDGFVYMVSSSATTGTTKKIFDDHRGYFEKVNAMQLKNQRLIGFGIHDNRSYKEACNYAAGAIVGTAFVQTLGKGEPISSTVEKMISNLRDIK